MLSLLEKITLAPHEVTASDVDEVREAEVSRQAISDALHVCFMFNLIDRLADSFAWHVPSHEAFRRDGKFLLKKGYDLIGPVSRRALAEPRRQHIRSGIR
jgi:hypothetical protein